jgi:hypothetical protein
MPQPERFDVLHRLDVARLGQHTAVVERQRIGGACPNIACMPTKNERRGGMSSGSSRGV